jgi:sugar transferase (PEP-CTERM/EpsH1 system associated)
MSKDLADWLAQDVGIPRSKIVQLYNGVDAGRFQPRAKRTVRRGALPDDFGEPGDIVIGTVGRLEPVKDQVTLVRAFVRLLEISEHPSRLRLVLLGDGALRSRIETVLSENGATQAVWIAGSRDDVPKILPQLDVFVLPSLGEGISNTILEAMASGLPVVATRVGGNPELVDEGTTGTLVPAADPEAMAQALKCYVDDADLRIRHGDAGRRRIESTFSLEAMVDRYQHLYDACLQTRQPQLLVSEK